MASDLLSGAQASHEVHSNRPHGPAGALRIILGAITLFLPTSACAALVDVDLPPCLPLTTAITVDGGLADWQGVEACHYAPLTAFGAGDLQGERRDLAADVRFSYAAEALYLAVDWRSPLPPASGASDAGAWHQHGDGLELHLACDGVVTHIASWPGPDGRAVLRCRRGDEAEWRDLGAQGGSAAIASTSATGYGQELRIPWSAVTRSGAAPTGKSLRVMLDLAWRALPGAAIARLGEGIRMAGTDVTCNVLTSPERLFSRGYLPSSRDWGAITVAASAARPDSEEGPLGTGFTALTAGRAATPPVIDGDLGEWPAASLAASAYAAAFLGERFACAFGLQHDDANLYIAGRIAAPAPPLNPEPETGLAGFKGGDCLQVRLQRGARTVDLCAWFDSVRGTPALTAGDKQLADPLLLHHGARLKIVAGAGGYALEMALPWQLLFPGLGAPAAGERLRGTFQPWWAGTDPRFTLSGALTLERRGPLAVPYTVPRDAEVSLGVFGAAGELLRTLARADFRRAGANTEFWDGRDQDGAPLPAGSYQLKGLYHDPLATAHLLTVGNPGAPPWPTGDGGGDWLGDESNPQAAATDGKWVFLASPGCEKGVSVIGLDERGQRRWGVGSDLYPRSVALAVQGDFLYVLTSGPEMTDTSGKFTGRNAQGRAVLRCLDTRSGRPARFSVAKPVLKVATFPYVENMVGLWDFWNQRSFDPDTYGGLPRYGDCDFGETSEALGVAATATTVYLAMHTQNRLLAFDAVTAEPRPERDIPLDKPVGLLALSDQALLAVSGKRVVRIDLASKAVTTLVGGGLAAPFGVATDAAGAIYVSDWRDSFQVKVFSPAGQYLRAIGKPGGRPNLGPWQADGMLLPRGIAVTAAGELWVAEDDTTPRRVSVWNAQSGAFLRDHLGPTPYGGGSALWFDAQDPTILHSLGCRFRIDPARKTWTPLAIETRRLSRDQPFAFNGARWAFATRPLRHGQDAFVAIADDCYRLVFMREVGGVLVPAAALGCVHRWSTDDGTGRRIWDSDLYSHLVRGMYPECFRGHVGDNYAWSDLNGDGLVQADEVVWTKTIFRGDTWHPGEQMEFGIGWGEVPTPDWLVPFGGECKVAGGGNRVLFQVRPHGWAASGAPVFDLGEARMFATATEVEALYGDADGHIFSTGTEGGRPDPIACYDAATGKRLWRMAGAAVQGPKDVRATSICGELQVPGLGHVVATWQWHGNWRPYLLTTDGLYVGSPQDDGKLGPAGMWDESYRYVQQLPDGTPVLVNGANDAQHLLRITGLEHGGRFTAPLVISPADAARAAAAIPDAAAAAPVAAPPPLTIAWLDQPPAIDGDLGEWEAGRGVAIAGGPGRSATVALGRDATTLYLAYHVVEEAPLRNQGADWRTLFTSGDCVDLMLAGDATADVHRRGAVAGDLRLLLSVFQGKPLAVLYRPVVPGSAARVQLMAAQLDRIDQLAEARVAVRRGDGFSELEAAVPLAALGIATGEAGTLRGDVGVIYADATGRDRAKRAYHFNQRTTVTADLTTEATLQPAEWGPVVFPLGRNLLRNGGFEGGFSARAEDGWRVFDQSGGLTAVPAVEAARSGRRGLLIRQLTPVTYPAAAFDLPDYGAFIRAANGGAGGGRVTVLQTVPVTGGRLYSLRFFRRAEGMKPEEKKPGKGRGYSTLSPTIDWHGGAGGGTWVANLQGDAPEWVENRDSRFNDYGVAHPYVAPAGATSATIAFHASVNAPDILPSICVDDVEFVAVGGP